MKGNRKNPLRLYSYILIRKMHTYIWQETGLILLPSYWLILQNYKFFFLSKNQGSVVKIILWYMILAIITPF